MKDIKKGRCPICHHQRVYHRMSDAQQPYSGSRVSHYLCADCGYTEQYVHNTTIINDPAWQPVDMPVFSARKQEQESRRLFQMAARQSDLHYEERRPNFVSPAVALQTDTEYNDDPTSLE